MCAAPAVVAAVLEAAPRLGGRDPRPRPGPDHRGRRPAADEDRRAGRGGAGLGVHPDLRAHRDLAAAHRQPRPRRSGTTSPPRSAPASWSAPARRRSASRLADRPGRAARCWPAPTSCSRATGSSRRSRRRRWPAAGSTPATAACIDDDGYLTISDRKKDVIITGGENVSSIEVEDAIFSHPDVAEVAVIGVPEREVGRDDQGARGARPRARTLTEAGADRLVQGRRSPATRRRRQRRVPRDARPHGDRQAAEVQAARAVLGGPRPAGQLTAPTRARV